MQLNKTGAIIQVFFTYKNSARVPYLSGSKLATKVISSKVQTTNTDLFGEARFHSPHTSKQWGTAEASFQKMDPKKVQSSAKKNEQRRSFKVDAIRSCTSIGEAIFLVKIVNACTIHYAIAFD